MVWLSVFRFLGLILIILHNSCASSGQSYIRKSYLFLGRHGNSILTSSGNLTSQGRVLLLTSSSLSILDLQGGSTVTFPRERCLENLALCERGFTISLVFRITHAPADPTSRIYLLHNGRNHSSGTAATGISLLLESNVLTTVLSGTTQVWKVEVRRGISEGNWHQLFLSWHPVLGLWVWAGTEVLGSVTQGQLKPTHQGVTAGSGRGHGDPVFHGLLTLGSEDNAVSVHFQVSGFTFMEVFVTEVLTGGLDGLITTTSLLETDSPTPSSSSTSTTKKPETLPPTHPAHPTTATTPKKPETLPPTHPAHPTTATTLKKSDITSKPPDTQGLGRITVHFLAMSGQQILTTQGIMTSHGDVTLEQVSGGLALVLDNAGQFVDLGHPLPCLRDVTSCDSGFNLRITFQLIQVITGQNVLLSNGGDQSDSAGVALTYFNKELVFLVKGDTTTWMGLYAASIQPGVWYTVDASWAGQHTQDNNNGTIYLNNVQLPGRVYSVSHPPPPPSTQPLLLGGWPDWRGGSSLMKVHEVDIWPTDRDSVTQKDLALPLLSNELPAVMTQKQESTEATSAGDDPKQTQVSNNEDLENRGDDGIDNKVVVIVLATLCSILTVSAIVGIFLCWRSRRKAEKQLLSLRAETRPRSLSLDYTYHARPRAYHNRTFSNTSADVLY